MDPYRSGGVPSPTTGRFPAGARGGNFLPPVSGPPTPNRMQMRRPSQTSAPSPRDSGSPSHLASQGPNAYSPRTAANSVDRQGNLALGSPPVWRKSGDNARAEQVVLGRVADTSSPGTPARKASGGLGAYGAGQVSPGGYGLGINSPSPSTSGQSVVTPGQPPRMFRVPSRERLPHHLSPQPTDTHLSPRQKSPAVASPSLPPPQSHPRSPAAPTSYLPPDVPRRHQNRKSSDIQYRPTNTQKRDDQRPGSSGGLSVAAAERNPDARKISLSLERDGSDPSISSPLNGQPPTYSGQNSSTPPARPRHASADLVLLPGQSEPRLSTPPHTTIDRARESRLLPSSKASPSKIFSAGRASIDENLVARPLTTEGKANSGELGKKRAQADSPKVATPRKSSGVLRSLFGKKKESAPSPVTSPTASSFPNFTTPSQDTPPRRTSEFDGAIPSPGRMSKPRTTSSPSLPAPDFSKPPRRAPAVPSSEYSLPAPPAPQTPLPSMLSTDSTGLLSSSDSIPSLQQREKAASSQKARTLLRRLSDQSSNSASSLSYLASDSQLSASASASSNRAKAELLPHLKSSGSLRLLALPDFGGSLDLGNDVSKLADALRSSPDTSHVDSFQPQLDGEDSWSSLLAAMSSGSPDMISAAFEGARQSIMLQNDSDLEKALADLQLEVNKQVANLPPKSDRNMSTRSLSSTTNDESEPPTSPPVRQQELTNPVSPSSSSSTPIKNPNLTITVIKQPSTAFKGFAPAATAPLNVSKRTLSAPSVSTEHANGPSSLPKSTPEDATEGEPSTESPVVMTSASLPSLRSKPVLRHMNFTGRILTIAAARRQRQRKNVNYRLMAEKMGDCLGAVRSSSARAPLIRGVLLPLLYELEHCGFDAACVAENKLMRACCFEWLVGLVTKDLWLEHTPSERGAILEAVATLLESPALSERALATDPADATVFRKILRTVISFVMIKLSSKGIFQNTLSFAGRMLAFAFFRVEGIAQQLLSSMPITRMALVRMETALHEAEARSPKLSYKHESERFPTFLAPFSLVDPRQYVKDLGQTTCSYDDPEDEAAFRFQPGNWLRRWQSDDSELFFSFFRAYHRRLSAYFPSIQEAEHGESLVTSVLFQVPGYAHLATVFTSKCVSYVQGKINSVTTTSNATTFNSTETAGFAGNSGKPPVLESANRRLSETILLLLNSPTIVDVDFGTEVPGSRMFGLVSELWFRILVGRTNMYEPKGVFCLFDLLDVVTTVPPDPFKEVSLVHSSPLAFTTVFLLTPLSIIIKQSDHALTLCKCVSYIFQHWDALTADPVDRSALVDLLLDQEVFDRIALFWSQSVRSYVVRLIVFRLSHISQRGDGPSPAEVQMVATLNSRMERIRRRHADLEPYVLGSILEDDIVNSLSPPAAQGLKRSRSTIAMVRLPAETDAPTDEYVPSGERNSIDSPLRAPRPGAEVITGGSTVGKATQWFKKSFGVKKKRGSGDDLSSQSSTKTLTGIAEDAESPSSPTTSLPSPPTIQPSASSSSQHPPLFSPLPSPKPDLLSPTRSSFESNGLPSPADFFFSEDQEKKLANSDAFQPSGLALPGPSFPRNNPFINAALAPTSPTSSQTSLASYSFGSRGSADSSYSTDTATPTALSPNNTTGVFTFGFAASPVSDSFEINASQSLPTIVLPPGQAAHPPASPISPTNRMSRSFSRRSTLLTPLASHILEDLANAGEDPAKLSAAFAAQKDVGYDKKLHPYAVQFLAELELTMEEYIEWYGPDGAGTLSVDGAPPRLNVGWNFHDDE